MNSGLNPADPTLVAAFRSAMLHQGALALAIVAFLALSWAALSWATLRTWRPGLAQAGHIAPPGPEPLPRRVLRIGFGALWLLDGILQAQPKMAGGLASQVIAPATATSPSWVQHVVSWGADSWLYHPIQAAAASVWIQIGIGAWLLVAARGTWSRLAALASVAWALVVWVFGEAFGQIFAPGLSWLFGAPGAVLLYAVAGALVALPETAWRGDRMRLLLPAGTGLFFTGMAVLQAWPGRGFWQGTAGGTPGGAPGTLTGMIEQMAGTSQPHILHLIITGAASFTAAHGWGVNLFAVLSLAAIGVPFLTGRRPLIRYAVWYGGCLCLAVWLLVQDLGFLGGLGTDPNSMIPTILLLVAAYLCGAAVPAGETSEARGRVLSRTLSVHTVAAVSAAGVVLVGAAPLAAATVSRTADPILAQAIAGNSVVLDTPAPGFTLTDQNGRTVSLASLRGKAVLLTFLDPVCTTDCPLIGAEFRAASQLLGAQAKNVALVAVVANPTYYSAAAVRAFDAEEGMNTVPGWLYLTGPLSALEQVWNSYGIGVQDEPAGAMSAHNDLAVVISPAGQIRQELSDDPGPGTLSTQSSFASLLAQYARQALNP